MDKMHYPIAAMEFAEYHRARDHVRACVKSGHAPSYNNPHADEALWRSYDDGFRAGEREAFA